MTDISAFGPQSHLALAEQARRTASRLRFGAQQEQDAAETLKDQGKDASAWAAAASAMDLRRQAFQAEQEAEMHEQTHEDQVDQAMRRAVDALAEVAGLSACSFADAANAAIEAEACGWEQ